MPRFVVLHHECPETFGKPSHWDLMLEREGALLTWSLPRLPVAWDPSRAAAGGSPPSESLLVERLADHRLAYLDYEGPISGDRGRVMRQDEGEYRVLAQSEGALRVEVRGNSLLANVELIRVAGDQWRLIIAV